MRLSGGVLVLAKIANGLAARGFAVTIVTTAGGADFEIKQNLDPQVKILSAVLSLEQTTKWTGKIRLSFQLARLVPPSSILIATHTPTVVPTMLARRLLRRSGRAIWFNQDYAEMFEKRPLEHWLFRRAPKWFERVITVSQACREEIERASGVLAWVVPQGYSLTEEPLPENPLPPSSKVVLYVGDRRPRKGWDDFIQAMSLLHDQHPDLRLAIVSKEDDPLTLTIPHDFYPRVSWKELLGLYRSCTIFVSASWWEGFGRPPLEAMAQGAPVVTTDSRGVREFAKDGINCLMTPVKNPAALAAAVNRLLNDPALKAKLSEAGRKTALEFTWEKSIDRFIKAID